MRQTGYTSKGTTPWSHSRRPRFLTAIAALHPANPFHAYFIPEALMGFSLQGFLLDARPEHLHTQHPLVSFRQVATVPKSTPA